MIATAVTLVLVLLGFVLVRSESWAGCWLMQRSLVGWNAAAAGEHWVPVWVPALVGMVAVGHFLGALRGYGYKLLELAPPVRAAVYVAAVVLLVVFGPWTSKSFIYFQF